ncbi:MAG: energy transducer TonB [Candidatus Obscuribacterales bacterium]|jgi:TonB family protein|nr:energy transducer TonB [Candidatus Obscuribacterales bacterium]
MNATKLLAAIAIVIVIVIAVSHSILAPPCYAQDTDTIQAVEYVKTLEAITRQNWHPPRRDVSNNVKIHASIAKDGTVYKLEVLGPSGDSEVDEAARKAVMTSKFPPHKFGEKGIWIELNLAYNLPQYALGDSSFADLKERDTCRLISSAMKDLKKNKSIDAATKTNKVLNQIGVEGLKHSYGIMTMLIQYFALMQAQKKEQAEKVLIAGKKFCPPDLWPAAAFRYLSKELSESQFLEKADSTREKTQANWVIGTNKLLSKDLRGAYKNFRWIEQNDRDEYLDYLHFSRSFTRVHPDQAKLLFQKKTAEAEKSAKSSQKR